MQYRGLGICCLAEVCCITYEAAKLCELEPYLATVFAPCVPLMLYGLYNKMETQNAYRQIVGVSWELASCHSSFSCVVN